MLELKGVQLFTAPRGFLMARIFAGEAELLTIATDPDHRRQGTASALLGRFLGEAAAFDSDIAFLEVAANNTAALALYHSFDFIERGRRPDYYKTPDGPVDALVMSRAL